MRSTHAPGLSVRALRGAQVGAREGPESKSNPSRLVSGGAGPGLVFDTIVSSAPAAQGAGEGSNKMVELRLQR